MRLTVFSNFYPLRITIKAWDFPILRHLEWQQLYFQNKTMNCQLYDSSSIVLKNDQFDMKRLKLYLICGIKYCAPLGFKQ